MTPNKESCEMPQPNNLIDKKTQDYINREADFAISNLKRKGVNNPYYLSKMKEETTQVLYRIFKDNQLICEVPNSH